MPGRVQVDLGVPNESVTMSAYARLKRNKTKHEEHTKAVGCLWESEILE